MTSQIKTNRNEGVRKMSETQLIADLVDVCGSLLANCERSEGRWSMEAEIKKAKQVLAKATAVMGFSD